MYKFSDRLKEAMKARNIRQTDLATMTNISKSMISEYVNDKYEPKADNLKIIANVLSVNEVWLMGYDGFGMDMESQVIDKNQFNRSLPETNLRKRIAVKGIVEKQFRDQKYTPYYDHILDNLAYLNVEGIKKVNDYINDLKKIDQYSSKDEPEVH